MQQHLPVYNNQTKLNLSDTDLAQAEHILKDMMHSLQFFYQRLHETPKMTDVHTHMGLFESQFKELSPLVKYNSVLAEERERRYKDIREMNKTIHKLEAALGEKITPEGITARLHDYDDAFRCFYGACGFHYASNKEYNMTAIQYEISSELEYEQTDGLSSRKEDWTPYFKKQFDLITKEDTAYDIYHDTYHAELLDTDNNRKRIQELFEHTFPNCRFWEFKSRPNDFGSMSLRFTVTVHYTDLDNLIKNIETII